MPNCSLMAVKCVVAVPFMPSSAGRLAPTDSSPWGTAGGLILEPLNWMSTGGPPSDAAMFDVVVFTASAILVMSVVRALARSAASCPHLVLNCTAFGP